MILILFLTFGLNSQMKIKEECPKECESCDTNADGVYECFNCAYGFGFMAGTKTCKKCTVTNCAECRTDYTKCESCTDGYGVDTNEKCQKCNSEGCNYCPTDYTKCLGCLSGYGFIFDDKGQKTDSCEKCPEHCQNCYDDSSSCTNCLRGYGFAINEDGTKTYQCVKCPDHCKECGTDSNTCDQCESYAYKINGKCSICVNNADCEVMGDSLTITCYQGYGPLLDDNSKIIGCAPCPLHCESCSTDSEKCDTCESGYGPVLEENKATGKCQKCTGLCLDCSNDYTKCQNCLEGSGREYVGGEFTGNCIQCPPGCDECSSDYTECQKCSHGYGTVLDDQGESTKKCELCPSFCESCSSSKVCSRCVRGYGLENGKCKPCPRNCAYCDDGVNFCTDCLGGYIEVTDNDGKIISCVPGPEEIYCDAGYGHVLDDEGNPTGECKKCSENCVSCDYNYKECDYCRSGYGHDGEHTNCKKCIDDNCQSCSNVYTRCETCNEGYYKDIDYKCLKCEQDHCKICYTQNYCNTCEDGYISLNDGRCVENVPNCEEMGYSGCISCTSGYGLKNGQCVECSDTNCLQCSKEPGFCEFCKEGYGLELDTDEKSTGRCQQCSANCKFCASNYKVCTACKPGYGFVRDSGNKLTNQCAKCPDNCYSCHYDSTKCTECNDGFGMELSNGISTGKCKPCPPNCKSCNNDYSTCSTCNDHFGLNKNGQCEKCPQNCEFCNKDSSFCAYCEHEKSGTYIGQVVDRNDQFIGQCKACDKNCEKCEDADKCEECKYGYGPVINSDGSNSGKCEKCPDNCYSCYSNNKVCEYCSIGYGLEYNNGQRTGKCIKCSSNNCMTCNSIPLISCDSCKDGFTSEIVDGKVTGNCLSCPENCDKCIDTSKCVNCKSGFGLSNDGLCTIKCPLNCEDCTENECLECESGFNFVNGKCIECLPNCYSCDEDRCNDCRPGYGFIWKDGEDTNRCGKCKDNCLMCNRNNDECLVCAENYCYNEDESSKFYHTCIRCDVEDLPKCNVENCFMCDSKSPDTCIECNPSYDLDYSGKCIEQVKVIPKPRPDIKDSPVVSEKIDNGKYEHVFKDDTSENEQPGLRIDENDGISELILSDTRGRNPLIIIEDGVSEITIKPKAESDRNFEIEPPSSLITINLEPSTQASIIRGKGIVEIKGLGNEVVNLNLVEPSTKSFQIVPKSKIIINEVEFTDSNAALLIDSTDASKVEIKSMKLQNGISGKIENSVVTGTVLFGSSSSLEINELVDLQKATLDCSDYQTVSDEAPIIGKKINTIPNKILINERNNDARLEEERKLLIAEAEQFDCEKWAKKIDNKKFKDSKCDTKGEDGKTRLFVYEKESKSKLSAGEIAGIVIGVVAFVGIVVFLCVYFLVIKKKKNLSSEQEAEDDDKDANEV